MSGNPGTILVAVAELRPGLYVSALDRPWEGTPFPLQGFRIDGPDDIRVLAEWCRRCHVDTRRSDAAALAGATAAANSRQPR